MSKTLRTRSMALEFSELVFDLEGETDDANAGKVRAHTVGQHELRVHLCIRALDGKAFPKAVDIWRRAEVSALDGAKVIERTSMKLAQRDAWVYAHSGTAADGVDTRCMVALIRCGEDMVVLSSFGPAEDFIAQRNGFEDVLKTVRSRDDALPAETV